MKKGNKKLFNIICVAIALVFMVYLFHEVFISNYKAYETETVTEIIQQETISAKAFIVRDEQYIDGNSAGTLVPLVTDGNRVASGDSVARVCKSEEDAVNYAKLIEYKEELERYKELSEQTELSSLDMKKLNNDIDEIYTKLLKITTEKNYSELEEVTKELENKLASKQILTNGDIDLTEKFNDINTEISSLESLNISTSDVLAPVSGYYISTIDGYEKTVDYDKVTSLSPADIENAISSDAAQISGKMGKIVGSYKWYLACAVDSNYSTFLSKDDTLTINIPYYGCKDVSVNVESVSADNDGKIAVIFSCNMMDEAYANMRIVDIELVLNEYTGYKVNAASVRSVKDSDGNNIDIVYIVRGNIMNARRVEIIYDAGDYFVVKENSEIYDGYKPIKLYDEIIVKGRNLDDGKSVG